MKNKGYISGYDDPDTFEGGIIPDEVREDLEAYEEAKKQARKEERITARDHFRSYKLKLNI